MFYTIMTTDDWQSSWALNLTGETREQCERAVNWQIRGGDAKRSDMCICTYDKKAKAFVGVDRTLPKQPDQGPYNAAAWARTMGELSGDAYECRHFLVSVRERRAQAEEGYTVAVLMASPNAVIAIAEAHLLVRAIQRGGYEASETTAKEVNVADVK